MLKILLQDIIALAMMHASSILLYSSNATTLNVVMSDSCIIKG